MLLSNRKSLAASHRNCCQTARTLRPFLHVARAFPAGFHPAGAGAKLSQNTLAWLHTRQSTNPEPIRYQRCDDTTRPKCFGCTGLRLQPDVSRLSVGLSGGLRPPFPSLSTSSNEVPRRRCQFRFPQGRRSPCRDALLDSRPTADPIRPCEVAASTCGLQSTPLTLRVSDACLRVGPGRFKRLSCITGHGFAFS
jgi:hypothetical protein